MKYFFKPLLISALLLAPLTSCNDQWDQHVEVNDPTLSENILSEIKNRPELSSFYNMLKSTGYDEVLQRAVTFTVFAPTNDALNSMVGSARDIVRNHIAYYSYSEADLLGKSRIRMVNNKNLVLSDLGFPGTAKIKNILCNNGILHVVTKIVEPAQNIYEYIEERRGTSIQIDSILNKTIRIMDMDKSIQIGVNELGRPVYDTIWTNKNEFLEATLIDDEDIERELVLIDDANFNKLVNKYAHYMKQGVWSKTENEVDTLLVDTIRTHNTAANEVLRDLVLLPGTDASLDGIRISLKNQNEIKMYNASNGSVREFSNIEIPIKNNKIREIIVEAESLTRSLDSNYDMVRERPWASNRFDVMVASRTVFYTDSVDHNGNRILGENGEYIKSTQTQVEYVSGEDRYTTSNNFFLEYNVKVHSVDYDIYWVTYDDYENHCIAPFDTLNLMQKLMISLPGRPSLSRSGTSPNNISNNYLGGTMAFVGETKAGIHKEVQLNKRHLTASGQLWDKSVNTEIQDEFGFSPQQMGSARLWVCNSCNYDRGGMMFLDYIRLVPRINDED